uniref:EGF-like domain-containing protein n=1 Tax=Macrostomum lignano TaxID=282301 RepID=A0A1I8FM88_9PLAT
MFNLPDGGYCKSGKCKCLEPTFSATTGPDGELRCVQVQDACTGVSCPANSTCQGANGGAGCVRMLRRLSALTLGNWQCVNQKTPATAARSASACRNNSCWCRSGYTGRRRSLRRHRRVQRQSATVPSSGGLHQHRGSYRCECPANYDGDGYNFCDLNECKLGATPAHRMPGCINTLGSYRCECPDGYIGDGKICIKGDNPCLFNNGGCGSVALCTWDNQQVTCQCPAGYSGNGLQCYDINECMEGTHNCDRDHAICTNNPGSFYCMCKRATWRRGCSNTDGAFNCACKPGYRGDGVATYFSTKYVYGRTLFSAMHSQKRTKCTCDKTNIALLYRSPLISKNIVCSVFLSQLAVRKIFSNESCQLPSCRRLSPPSRFATRTLAASTRLRATRCECNPGLPGQRYDACRDINECAQGRISALSTPNAATRRARTPASAAPVVGDGRKFCNDINECLDPEILLGQAADGVRQPARPASRVRALRAPSSRAAAARTSTNATVRLCNKCHASATCTNTQGSYTCACQKGYIGGWHQLSRRRRVPQRARPTATKTLCASTPRAASTVAAALASWATALPVTTVDECDKKKPRNQCHKLATCINKNPGYACVCPPGFDGTDSSAPACITFLNVTQRNPCSTPGLCSSNATCVFDGTQHSLPSANPATLAMRRICVAAPPALTPAMWPLPPCVSRKPIGFDCECKPGFHKEGNLCVDNDECDPASPYFRPGVCGDPLMAKQVRQLARRLQLSLHSPGHQVRHPLCIPLDVCANGEERRRAAQLTPTASTSAPATDASASPASLATARPVQTSTSALTALTPVYGGATCRNTVGGYRCECPKGLVQAADPRTCVDFDECTNDPYICGNYSRCCVNTRWRLPVRRCTNTPGSCTCRCRPGYNGDGVYFCELNQNCPPPKSALCPAGTICRDRGNSTYDCRCPADQLDKGVESCASGVCVHFCQKVDPCWTRAP